MGDILVFENQGSLPEGKKIIQHEQEATTCLELPYDEFSMTAPTYKCHVKKATTEAETQFLQNTKFRNTKRKKS